MESAGLFWGTKKRLSFCLFFRIDFLAFFVYCVCLGVMQLVIIKDEILEDFITQLRERALLEFRQQEKEIQDRYDRVRELSMKSHRVLSQLDQEIKQAIEAYMDAKDSLTCDELDYVYLRGIMDCCKILKHLKII